MRPGEDPTMRRSTTLALVAGGATAAVAAAALARGRLAGRGPEGPLPDEDAYFTLYAPGGRYGFFANGPVGWVIAKLMPVGEAGVYTAVAEVVDLQPDDDLLDIGCGPGAFLAAKAQHVRRVVGLDPSPTMLHAARAAARGPARRGDGPPRDRQRRRGAVRRRRVLGGDGHLRAAQPRGGVPSAAPRRSPRAPGQRSASVAERAGKQVGAPAVRPRPTTGGCSRTPGSRT